MGRLTTHVLDTAQGKPGAGIKIELFKLERERLYVKTTNTNGEGRTDEPLLDRDEFSSGTWELVFTVDQYFLDSALAVSEPPFLDQITIRFTISTDGHYHIPLLVSPWSYATYRGS